MTRNTQPHTTTSIRLIQTCINTAVFQYHVNKNPFSLHFSLRVCQYVVYSCVNDHIKEAMQQLQSEHERFCHRSPIKFLSQQLVNTILLINIDINASRRRHIDRTVDITIDEIPTNYSPYQVVRSVSSHSFSIRTHQSMHRKW